MGSAPLSRPYVEAPPASVPILLSLTSRYWIAAQQTLREQLFPNAKNNQLIQFRGRPTSAIAPADVKPEPSDDERKQSSDESNLDASEDEDIIVDFAKALENMKAAIQKCDSNIADEQTFRTLKLCNNYTARYRSSSADESDVQMCRCADALAENGYVDLAVKLWPSIFDERDIFNETDFESIEWLGFECMANTLWSATDSSDKFCKEICKNELIGEILVVMAHRRFNDPHWQEAEGGEQKVDLIRALLSIVWNTLRRCQDEAKTCIRRANGLTVLKRFVRMEISSFICALSLFILGIVTNEEEANLITAGTDVFEYIINGILRPALNNRDVLPQMWVDECIEGLNGLSKNDMNKLNIGNTDALGLFEQILSSAHNNKELLAVTHAFWILSFCEANKNKIREMPVAVEELKKLSNSAKGQIQLAAKCALWNLGLRDRPATVQSKENKTAQGSSLPHVMISYQWKYKPITIRVNTLLQAAGYRTWMDVDKMTGSTLDAMAKAVEDATVILMFISEEYKISASCRQEAEYAAKLRKDIVPVLTQYRYKPDGWLGILLGTKLYFDCSAVEKIDNAMDGIMKELGDRGRGSGGVPLQLVATPERASTLSWKTVEVGEWLRKIGLKNYEDRFNRVNGAALCGLAAMYERAPAKFYETVEKKFEINDAVDLLIFSHELQKLSRS